MQIEEPECRKRRCKHFTGVGTGREEVDGEAVHVPVCRAFPTGIPKAIAYGTNKHTRPFRGDGGIQFEKGR